MDCNQHAVYACDFFWWPIRLFTWWKHIKNRAVKLAATAKRYCLEILAINAFFYYGGLRFCKELV